MKLALWGGTPAEAEKKDNFYKFHIKTFWERVYSTAYLIPAFNKFKEIKEMV